MNICDCRRFIVLTGAHFEKHLSKTIIRFVMSQKIKPDLDGFAQLSREPFHWLTQSAVCAYAGFVLAGLVVAVLFTLVLDVPLFAVLPLTALLKYRVVAGHVNRSPRSFEVSPHPCGLEKGGPSDVTHINGTRMTCRMLYVLWFGSSMKATRPCPSTPRQKPQWLRRLFKYYHREAHGAGGGVPQSLEELRQLT